MTAKLEADSEPGPNVQMSMSPDARARMQATEKAVYRYYNDMGKNKGHCTWGAGILAHKGVCSADELKRKVSAPMVDQEFGRRVGDAERVVRRNTKVTLNQAQFDALVSLTYNAGPTGARGTFGYVNQRDFVGAADNISQMTKVSVIEKGKKKYVIALGLIHRRAEESAPFRVTPTIAPNK
ncbi:glycoside hydrolase family protein [Massilia sp. R2A-15]|uniref:lysozyme n=1 Tax=Massilia sp. R2A-15 TaxID=3064278 RepID=UPI002736B269|nr:glycoside hydrolase family protein [Massilia sp. R2A-15]WLI88303.1 glycoside hydrolase family protein [Massilia sp. R2A-15]